MTTDPNAVRERFEIWTVDYNREWYESNPLEYQGATRWVPAAALDHDAKLRQELADELAVTVGHLRTDETIAKVLAYLRGEKSKP